MNPILLFILALLLILLLSAGLKLHPFISLITVSFIVGALSTDPIQAIEFVSAGMGRVFSLFAVVITAGSIIGIILERTGATSIIADDLIRLSRKPLLAINLIGFLFAVPLMCCILAYVVFIPIARDISHKIGVPMGVVATSLGLGTMASFNLVYPSPVIYSAAEQLGPNTTKLTAMGLMVAFILSIIGYIYATKFFKPANLRQFKIENVKKSDETQKSVGRLQAYAPISISVLLILSSLVLEHPLTEFFGNPNIALLIGVMLSITSARSAGLKQIREWIEKAVRRSGVVILDLCGGGALGAALTMTGAGQELSQFLVQQSIPTILIPFLVAIAIQSVQGSRVVTMLVATPLLMHFIANSGLPVEIAIMSMASGTFLVSHVNDPYFWIFGDLADIKPPDILKSYTAGGGLMGLAGFAITCLTYILIY